MSVRSDLEAELRANADPETAREFERLWRPVANTPADDIVEVDHSARLKAGGRFVLDDPSTLDPVWGRDDQVLWAAGEPLLVVGPTGVGKSTLDIQLVAGRLGIIDELLGYPIVDDGRKVLYLAMDRPRQIRRAMRRVFGEEHRDVLDERLVVWEGPLPYDLGKHPLTLLEIARSADAGTVIIDSLKDATVKLTDDEAGGNLNRAIQYVIADRREVLGSHHQRKGQGGARPTTLEDVYGSTWITAGMGSVILLWGAAGDPLVDLVHLKQPASEVGPLRVEHDHVTGRSTVFRGVADPLVVLRNHSAHGLTTLDLARIMFEVDKPNDNQRKKAQRQLDRLVTDGLVHKQGFDRGGDGGSTSARYYLVAGREVETESHPEQRT